MRYGLRTAVVGAALALASCGSTGEKAEEEVEEEEGQLSGTSPEQDEAFLVEDEPLITTDGDSASNDSAEAGEPGAASAPDPSDQGDCDPQVIGLLRDFTDDHPNFEDRLGSEKGIVSPRLGPDRKPVFAGGDGATVTNAADFDQWYRDEPGVNESFQHELDFSRDPDTGNAVYDNSSFFPLDGRGFGDQDRSHNFHFTFELHMRFRYEGGEIFSFTGDDDLFVFINDRLAIDLGGVHFAESQTVDLDERAAELGIEIGQEYPIDFFQAERHTSQSNFRIETTLLFTNCEPIIIPARVK